MVKGGHYDTKENKGGSEGMFSQYYTDLAHCTFNPFCFDFHRIVGFNQYDLKLLIMMIKWSEGFPLQLRTDHGRLTRGMFLEIPEGQNSRILKKFDTEIWSFYSSL